MFKILHMVLILVILFVPKHMNISNTETYTGSKKVTLVLQ